MPMVSSELWIRPLERWISMCFWLLDTVCIVLSALASTPSLAIRMREGVGVVGIPILVGRLGLIVLRRVG